MDDSGVLGVAKNSVPFWLGPLTAAVGWLESTEAAKRIRQIDNNAPNIDRAVQLSLELGVEYTSFKQGNVEDFSIVKAKLAECKGMWIQVGKDTGSWFFRGSPLLKAGAVTIFGVSAMVAPKSLLISMVGSLLVFRNSEAITAIADEKMVKWVEENQLAFVIVSSAAGGVMTLWTLNGVGWVTALPYQFASIGLAGATGVLGGAYLNRTGVLSHEDNRTASKETPGKH